MELDQRWRLSELNEAPRAEWVRVLGGVFEHSPQIAEEAWEGRPYGSVRELLEAMVGVVERGGEEAVVRLLRAHPDLGVRVEARAALTRASAGEQAGAGLFELGEEARSRLQGLNGLYRERFGFPLIICARLNSVRTILEALERRVGRERAEELKEAWGEVKKIAQLRLGDLIEGEG
ncbi:MAG: 2-oxo-4-hydroxy-4-carboxy-5-ureidoimidazoline decarboxylase [Verrucomicrobiia bacterium]